MATTYAKAGGEERGVLVQAMQRSHTQLVAVGVTIDLLAADNDDGPALTYHGYPARAIARIVKLRDRVAGLADASICFDYQWWRAASPAQRLALIDHELTHLELRVHPKTNQVRLDDAGRPKLKIRRHDWHFGGFDDVAGRHKFDSAEIEFARMLFTRLEQLQFDFMRD